MIIYLIMAVVLSVRELMRNLVIYVHFFNVNVVSKMKSLIVL